MRLRIALSWPRFILAGLLVLVMTLYASVPNTIYHNLERAAYDQMVAWSPTAQTDNRIVLIDIDEKSLREFGAWPWPRKQVAQLIDQLTQHYQVAVLGVDIVFPETKEDDGLLKAALNQPNVVFSQVLDFSASSENHVGQLAGLLQTPDAHYPGNVTGFIANHPNLLSPTSQVGHISPIIDADGKVRRIYPVACAKEGCTAALSLRLYQALNGAAQMHAEINQQAMHIAMLGSEPLTLPLDQERAMVIPYRIQVGGFHYVSAADVLKGQVSQDALNNAIVVLGSTALGLGDHVATPTQSIVPGLEIHAQLMSAILDQTFITPQHGLAWVLIPSLLIALLYLFWPWRTTRGLLIWTSGTLLLVLGVSVGLFVQLGWWMPLSPMPLMVLLLGVLGLVLESMRLNQQLRVVAHQFSRFIPESLVNRLIRGRRVGPNSDRRELTVLVADMRGFTGASEGKTPEAVAALAQQCLDTLTKVVYHYGGTIEKYSGDGLMAIWGAPTRDALHAQHAVEAGLKMQQDIDALAPWFIAHDFKPMKVSVGINTGEMAVGVFGGDAHLAWTAHGDAVNVASRIEQLTRTVDMHLLIGQKTAELYGMDKVNYCGEHHVKGRHGLVAVYSVLG